MDLKDVEQLALDAEEYLRFIREHDIRSGLEVNHNLLAFLESEEPFEEVMAFSEGASVVASLLAYQERLSAAKKRSPFRFKCRIFFSREVAFEDSVLRELSPSADGEVITIPTATSGPWMTNLSRFRRKTEGIVCEHFLRRLFAQPKSPLSWCSE